MAARPHQVAGHAYVSKSDHRDGTAKKSQWVISVVDEERVFGLAVSSGWTLGDRAWGLHIEQNKARYLGTSATDPGPAVNLIVALFEIAATSHGYPADPRRSNREKPPTEVQREWLRGPYIRAAAVRKLGQGQRCRL